MDNKDLEIISENLKEVTDKFDGLLEQQKRDEKMSLILDTLTNINERMESIERMLERPYVDPNPILGPSKHNPPFYPTCEDSDITLKSNIGDIVVPKTEAGDISYTTTTTSQRPPEPPKSRILKEGEIPIK